MSRLTPEQRESMDAHLGGGFFGYLERLRSAHRPTFTTGRESQVVYSGCTCGAVVCTVPYLLRHIDDLIASYNAKVQDFAAETADLTQAREVLRAVVESQNVPVIGKFADALVAASAYLLGEIERLSPLPNPGEEASR